MFSITVKGQSVQDLKMNLEVLINELDPTQVINAPILTVDPEDQLTRTSSMLLNAPVEHNIIYNDVKKVDHNLEVVPENLRELDSEGVPWDKRIHAGSRGKLANGMWRTKRGMEAEFVATIKAELLKQIELEANPIAIPSAPITEATPIVETPVAEVIAPVVTADIAPPVVELPKMGSGHSLETFTSQFPMIVGSLITEGKITQEYVNQLKEYFKVDQIWQVSSEQIVEVFASFVELGLVSKVA